MEGYSSAINSLPGALAVLGALGSDALGSVMLSQCIHPQSYCATSRFSQILDGACQPMVGPTFKLGSMLAVHTACAIAGRINDWDACAGFIPLREDQAQCYSTTEGVWVKQMGSCVYVGVQDHATAVVYGLKTDGEVLHHYIRMYITQNPTHQSRRWLSARTIGASWPLVATIVMMALKERLWASIVLLGWFGWLAVSLSAGSDLKSEHTCDSRCSTRQYLLNDQGVSKSLIEYTVCAAFDDAARRELPKRRTYWRMLRLVGSIFMAIHFPIGLVATCYNSSTGALIWVLLQFVGLIAGVRWWSREHRLVRHGIDCSSGLIVEDEVVLSTKRWKDVLLLVDKTHWPHIKHKYT